MTNMEILAKKLRMLRGNKSQMEFASELGITKATVQAIEGQKSNARIDTFCCRMIWGPNNWIHLPCFYKRRDGS